MKELDKLINSMEKAFASLPPLPKSIKDFIVVINPWVALIFGILGVFSLLSAIGLFTSISPFMALGGTVAGGSMMAAFTFKLMLGLALGFIAAVLMLVAFPGLRSNKASGWRMLFLSEAVSAVSNIIGISIIGFILSLVIFYILFQIKSYYK
ncbi:MAG: hypothetical protein Q7K55_05085 [Candidatus Levybacteria bacterium]|nr:hypothetical protein [Candidatus Levybacteria bacterium]